MVDQLGEEGVVGEVADIIMEMWGPSQPLFFWGEEADFLGVLPGQGLGGVRGAQTGHFFLVAAPQGGPGMAVAEPGTPPGAPNPVMKHEHAPAG